MPDFDPHNLLSQYLSHTTSDNLTGEHTTDGTSSNRLSKTPPPFDYLQLFKQNKLPPVTMEKLICEMQLLALGDFFPIDFKINTQLFEKEISYYTTKWVPYLPREGRLNDRHGLCLIGLEGDSCTDSLSIPEASIRKKKFLLESDFSTPTELYRDLTCLHPLFETFSPLARCFLLKCNEAGWFPPHRDGKWIGRDTFRLVAFLKNSKQDEYDWILDGKKLSIDEGRVYFINTRLQHKTFSMTQNSIHLIMNIPMTIEHVLKLISYTN